MSNYMLKIWD